MWAAKNKIDLIIEVWEKLDCESVGAAELEAIETAVETQYGRSAVDSPMIVARLLADEGAVLRHSEIMDLFVRRVSGDPYEAAFRNLIRFDDLARTLSSIRRLNNLREQYRRNGDQKGLRLIRDAVVEARNELSASDQPQNDEIAGWLKIWLETPDLFETWISLRMSSPDFVSRFGEMAKKDGEE